MSRFTSERNNKIMGNGHSHCQQIAVKDDMLIKSWQTNISEHQTIMRRWLQGKINV